MAQSLMEIINWNAGRSSIEDLVILGMSHDDTACEKNVMTLLGQHNIKYIKDCAKLKHMTVREAYERGRLKRGGSILAIDRCWDANWDPNGPLTTCSGFDEVTYREPLSINHTTIHMSRNRAIESIQKGPFILFVCLFCLFVLFLSFLTAKMHLVLTVALV